MEQSTAMLTKNTAAVEKSSSVIQANTDEVAHSTEMIKFFPWVILLVLAVLFYLSYRTLQQHRKLQKDIKKLLKK